MRVTHKLRNFFGGGILALLVAFATLLSGPATAVFADDVPEYRLQISPTTQTIDLKPGEKYEGTFQVQNTGSKAFKYSVSAAPYSVKGDDYSPDYDSETDYTKLASWITFSDQTGTVEPNSYKEIKYTASVPNDVAAGGQYAIMLAQIEDDDSSSQKGEGATIQTVRRVGMLVYAHVEGDTRETGKIIENKVPSFLFNPPITATSIVENTGNIDTQATYKVQVYPLFSDEEVYTNEEDPDSRTILPETRRYNSVSWDGAPQLGIFKVKQTVKIFDEESVVEKVVFLCPIWFLFIVLLIIFMVIFWIVMRIRNRNKE